MWWPAWAIARPGGSAAAAGHRAISRPPAPAIGMKPAGTSRRRSSTGRTRASSRRLARVDLTWLSLPRPACVDRRVRMTDLGSYGEQPGEVAGHLVDLQVQARATHQRPERGHGLRVRNNVNPEGAPVDLVHRQADAIHGDRALEGEEARQRSGNPDCEARGARVRAHAEHLGDAIDVPGNEVSPERIPGAQRRLQIHP